MLPCADEAQTLMLRGGKWQHFMSECAIETFQAAAKGGFHENVMQRAGPHLDPALADKDIHFLQASGHQKVAAIL